MEFEFTEHDGTIGHICDSSDGHILLEYGDGRNHGWNPICQKEDIGKLIETLQKAKEVIEVICEFTHNSTLYRILNKGGTYTLYYYSEGAEWVPYEYQIYKDTIHEVVKALVRER